MDQETGQQTNSRKLLFDLRKLSEKELKLNLHMINLSDYWRKDMIPRGLRLNKFPSFGYYDEEFKDKWEAILNKCSLDLILLLIEEAKKQKSALQLEIEKLKSELAQAEPEDKRLPFEQKLKEDLERLKSTLTQGKIETFKRDLADYSTGVVYKWGKKNYQTKRRVSFNIPSTDDDDCDDDDDKNCSQTSDMHGRTSFLESGPRQTNPPRTRGRGKRGGGRGGGRQPQPQTPTRQLRSQQ